MHPPRFTNQKFRNHAICLTPLCSFFPVVEAVMKIPDAFLKMKDLSSRCREHCWETGLNCSPFQSYQSWRKLAHPGHVPFLGHPAASDCSAQRSKGTALSSQLWKTFTACHGGDWGLCQDWITTQFLPSSSLLHRCWLWEHPLVNILHSTLS